jgi:hypothetical protein
VQPARRAGLVRIAAEARDRMRALGTGHHL